MVKELITGVLHPGNGLLFAKSLFFWVIIISSLSLSGLYLYRQTHKPPPPQVIVETKKGDLSLPDTILAEVGKQKIYKSDVKKLALTQYAYSAINDDVIKKYLELMIERSILDQLAAESGIVVSDTEIEAELAQFTDKNQTDLETSARYEILKRKVIDDNTNSVHAYVIGFWIPPKVDSPMAYPDTPEIIRQRADTRKALTDAENGFKAGEQPRAVAQKIYDKYPSLQPILGLNGYNFGGTKNENVFSRPRAFLKKQNGDAVLLNEEFYNTLFSLKEGDVATVFGENDSGGDVIKVDSIKISDYASYEEFIKVKEQELVKRYI